MHLIILVHCIREGSASQASAMSVGKEAGVQTNLQAPGITYSSGILPMPIENLMLGFSSTRLFSVLSTSCLRRRWHPLLRWQLGAPAFVIVCLSFLVDILISNCKVISRAL